VCTPPCAPQAMCRAGNSCECSLGYEGDGRVCTGKQVAVQVGGLLTSSVTWFSHSFLPPVVDLCQKGHGGCSEHANCSQVGTVVTCACLPNYEGDGWNCRARNPCLDSHRGGCSEHADCLNTGPVSRWGKQPGRGGPMGSLLGLYRVPTILPATRTHGAVSAM
jgi:hypothetical protein